MIDKSLVKFPEDFLLDSHSLPEDFPRLVASPLPHFVNALCFPPADGFEKLTLPLQSQERLFFALRGWEVFDDPRKSASPTSEAIYLAQSKKPRHGLLLKFLAPGSRTSSHYHKSFGEVYYLIAGQAKIITESAIIFLNVPGKSIAKIKTAPSTMGFHPVVTDNQPSVIIVQMLGGLRADDHYYA